MPARMLFATPVPDRPGYWAVDDWLGDEASCWTAKPSSQRIVHEDWLRSTDAKVAVFLKYAAETGPEQRRRIERLRRYLVRHNHICRSSRWGKTQSALLLAQALASDEEY